MDYGAILNSFTGEKRNYGFDISKPFQHQDRVVATDGMKMVVMPVSRFTPEPHEGTAPNPDTILEQATLLDKPIVVETKKLLIHDFEDVIESLKVPPPKPEIVYVQCSSCGGSGTCFCECCGEHDCERCDNGKRMSVAATVALSEYNKAHSEYESALREIPWVRIGDAVINYRFLRDIRIAVESAELTSITIRALDKNKPLWFEADDMQFAVMPLRVSGNEKCVAIDV